jgi:hypothetical protein
MRGVKKYGTHRVIYRSMHREVTYRLIDYGDSVTQVGDVGDHIANDGGVKQRTQKEVGESNEAITVGAYATRVALRKESRGCEAVIMQLIDTKIKFMFHAGYRTMCREVTYRLVDDGNLVTRDGDHVSNDGSTEQRTEKVVSESVERSRSLAGKQRRMSPCTVDEKSTRSNSPDGAERKERLQSERSSDEVK